MAKVINLNRFRKKKAKEAKELRADRNRRFHGRTKAERLAEEHEKRRLEKKLEGAFLVPERVDTEELKLQGASETLESLEDATRGVISLSEFSQRLARGRDSSSGSAFDTEQRTFESPSSDDESGRED